MPVLARWIVSTLAVTVTMLACTASDRSGGELEGPTWTVTSLPGATIPPGLRIDATFREDGTVEGSDGCNWYGGPYAVTGDGGIDIGGLGGTDIGCEPSIAEAGAAFASTLDRATSYEVDDQTLVLFDDDGAELVRLRANAGPPIGGVTWRAFGYRDGPVDEKQAVVSPLEGSSITAEFGADGTMTGSSGCNTYSADYAVDGNSFRITSVVSTERACEPRLMRQQDAYLEALGSVERWKFSGSAFQLLNETGTVEATYVPG